MNNKLGIFVNFWTNTWACDHVYYLQKAKKIGYDILEFQAQALLDMTDARMEEIKAAAKDADIELTYSLGLDPAYDISSPDESVRLGGMKYLTEIVRRIGKMEGKLLSGVSYAGWGIPAEINKEARFEASVKSMKELGKTAGDLGITYGIEAVNRFEGVLINTAKEARHYVDTVDLPNVGILLDTYHMNIEEKSFRDAILTAGDRLVGFHVGENNRTCPGRGHLDWNEIFGTLREVGYDKRIVAEPFVMAGGEVGRSIAVWRDLIDDKSEAALDAEAAYMLDFMKKA